MADKYTPKRKRKYREKEEKLNEKQTYTYPSQNKFV